MIYEKDSLPTTAGFEDGRESRDKEYRQLSETRKGKKIDPLLDLPKRNTWQTIH